MDWVRYSRSIVFVILAFGAWPVSGQDFRMETEVFSGNEKKPFAEHLTLFSNGVFYDFPVEGPDEITVFDYRRGRFIILNPARRIRTEVSTEKILGALAKILTDNADKDAPFLKPNLKETVEGGWLVLQDEHITYRAKGFRPPRAESAEDFHRFADWYARLNSLRPGNLPSFAREELNRAIGNRGWVPEQIELVLKRKRGLKRSNVRLRSRHVITWRLLETDQKKIDRAVDYMYKYDEVEFDKFIRAADAPARK